MKEKLVKGINNVSNVVQAVILGVLSSIIGFFIFVDLSNGAFTEGVVESVGFIELYFAPLLYALSTGVLTFFAWLVGKRCSDKVGYNISLKMSKKELKFNLISGAILGLFAIVITDLFFLISYPTGFKLFKDGIYYTIQSGFFEEVWYRVGLMGVFTYCIHRIIFKGKEENKARARKIGSIFISILLILIVLQDINMFLTLPRIQMVTGLLIKIVPALFYTWLFYKKGFYHSVTAHMTQELVMNFILIPLIHIIR